MNKVAIIQFPGSNCEYEARRAVEYAGMEGVLVRWNEDYSIIRKFDAYILPGGFSYEDRVRSGAIAARDPVMNVIKEEAERGKPVLGICNGAQILVEDGLIPGLNSSASVSVPGQRNSALRAALAANSKGWLNIWVSIINDGEPGRTPFNNYPKGRHFRLPIAHGEGRFVIPEDTLKQLIENGQTIFRYCDGQGNITNEFPVNPNGAVYNLAGVSNPAGNVLALMPHPERVKEGQVIFESLRKHLENDQKTLFPERSGAESKGGAVSHNDRSGTNIHTYSPPANTIELFVDLIITDNEAVTLENALNQMGFADVKVAKKTHWELTVEASQRDVNDANTRNLINKLITSGELLNTNKEIPSLRMNNKWYGYKNGGLHETAALLQSEYKNLLVRYNEDYEGEGKTRSLQGLGFNEITSVTKGIVWEIEAPQKDWERILETNILFNPYSQTAYHLSMSFLAKT